MLLFKTTASLCGHLEKARSNGDSIGFVPTMGALHQGHLSLVGKAQSSTSVSVCSIFVNPTQFNDAADLEKYPRTTSEDIETLANAGCDILFLPSVKTIYPDGPVPLGLDFGHLDESMEGAHRPGHFAGMAQVVKRLLDIVRPHRLFMGQKDYQQAAIVQRMLQLLASETELVVCPIVREPDGLAMSSRNKRLSKEQRALAPLIFKTLKKAREMAATKGPKEIEGESIQQLTVPGMAPEYFEIVDGASLRRLKTFASAEVAVACTAVRLGDIRLIDNMVLAS